MWKHVWTKWAERERRTFAVDFERYEGGPDEATVPPTLRAQAGRAGGDHIARFATLTTHTG
ncbi:hypothetical protein DB30_05236 [Enhygromyxa salina]|uniref:Uncharacterized protein n=1 Tax=Enhygromyxa salina TaxID=215803 RepID=A0A0C1ZXH4_9BACT|nr:hypothetical protein [Enhygromyxa salina]KIG15818.1 hypothetical protein DB30_05236 [Enhygromyxa salina]